MTSTSLDIPALAAEFAAAHPARTPQQQRIALALFRQLGQGQLVTAEVLAERSQLPPAEVTAFFDAAVRHRDAQGRVAGFGGLSPQPTSHVLEVDGRTLYAWCALDALFLPELLGRPARVRSTAPVTGDAITLAVDAAGVHDITPPGAVVSLRHAGGFDAKHAVETFCCYVHFFASEAAAQAWTQSAPGTYIVSIADGFAYGRHYNHARYGAVLDDSR